MNKTNEKKNNGIYSNITKTQKIILIVLTAVLVLTVLTGTSYSLWTTTKVQQGTNEVNVGCFNITYTNLDSYGGNEAGDINLVNTYPITDSEGSALTPYVFKIKNTCTIASDYIINLETLNTSNFNLDYLKVKFNEASNNTSTPTIYSSLENGTIGLTGQASAAKILTTGYLAPNEEITYALRAWIDVSATTSTSNVMRKTWNGKVVVVSEAASKNAVKTIQRLATGANTSSTDVIGNTGLAYDGTTDNNLRYVGSNPSNYVQFNGELWRIIGVMNNIQTEGGQTQSLIKLRRTNSLGQYSWDSSESSINEGKGINQWGESGSYEGADLMRELNTDYLGNITVGTDENWYSGENNAKESPKPNTTINSNAQNMIETVVWKLGSPNNDNGTPLSYTDTTLKPPYVYQKERGTLTGKVCSSGNNCNDTVSRTSSWTGKVGLFYISDYLYATSGGSTTNRAGCLNLEQAGWNSYTDCKDNDWLFDSSNYQWTILSYSQSSYASIVFDVNISSNVNRGQAYQTGDVRPVVFLKSSISITGGTGTEQDPYTLG